MYIAYYDESGDDGFPDFSSSIFVLSSIYMDHLNWKENYSRVNDFRKPLARDFSFPFHLEFHTREFLLDKNPYRALNISLPDRRRIVLLFCELVASMSCRIVNVVINKTVIQKMDYNVLDKAFTYSIQRIENDLAPGGNRFMIITDEGRVGKMRKTARRIQRFNPIPSKYSSKGYTKEIEHLIEDPLAKDSKESYFIQLADMVAYLVMLWMGHQLGARVFPKRLAQYMKPEDVWAFLDMIRPCLNLNAAPSHEFGIVCYPK